jgi:hypothetical protein
MLSLPPLLLLLPVLSSKAFVHYACACVMEKGKERRHCGKEKRDYRNGKKQA